MARAWRLPQEHREKPDVTQGESAPLEQPSRLQQMVPPPVPPPATPAFEIHETLPVDLQQPPAVTTPVEGYAASKAFGAAKGADLKMDVATLLASKSTLREAILLREILGTPRGLQLLDVTL
jgi:hypothetical protein